MFFTRQLGDTHVIPSTDGTFRIQELKLIFRDQIEIATGEIPQSSFHESCERVTVIFHKLVTMGHLPDILESIGDESFTEHQVARFIHDRFNWIWGCGGIVYLPMKIDNDRYYVNLQHEADFNAVVVKIEPYDSIDAYFSYLHEDFYIYFVVPEPNRSKPRFRIP